MEDYKDTLLMPKTSFEMRGKLPNKEPVIQEKWENMKLYDKIMEKNQGKPYYLLHDGPPYANGNIHIGHALNKILKDFVVRYKNMNGFKSPYVPGWDTHGLPIETALAKKGVDRKKLEFAEYRQKCHDYAAKQIKNQKEQFKRLGIIGEWENPYITYQKEYEAMQLKVFAKMVSKGLIYKGVRPVYWSWSSETALAEAEIEYHDKMSPSIYVAFDVVDSNDVLDGDEKFIIWTTTPWTIPANLAICLHPEIEYAVVKTSKAKYIIANKLVDKLTKEFNWEDVKVLKVVKGEVLEYVTCKHPLYDRESLVVLGDHVTADATGCVHTAPGHGEDDFIVGKKYNLDILCPVDDRGIMTKETIFFEGLHVEKANKAIGEMLEEKGALLKKVEFIKHSYPHDWRTKKPIIFRVTPQWFASIDALKDTMLKEIGEVKWYPKWGDTRLGNMIKDRKDWCISRQRPWGIPIPVFYAENGDEIIDEKIILHVSELFKRHGSNIWFEWDAKDLLPEGFTHKGSPNNKFRKEQDIMDVWFDSGSSHHSVLVERGLPYPADLYLEGSDQYRGWFNSSLSTGVAMTDKAPYKTVVTHGFVLDGDGRKMSKSLGNVIDPLKLMKQLGADILRLWVSSVDYQADVRISNELMKQVSESYRKIRNTFRFLLGNLFDFQEKDAIPYEKLNEIDRFVLVKLDDLTKEVKNAYDTFAFDDVYRLVNNYITQFLSSFYLDFTKDILYIENANSTSRRAIQTVLYENCSRLARLLAPIIPHTTDEVYEHLDKEASVHLADMPSVLNYKDSQSLKDKYERFLDLRDDVLKALEEARNQKIIGKSFNAKLTIYPNEETKAFLSSLDANLQQIFIVSQFDMNEINNAPENALEFEHMAVLVENAQGHTCSRCWQIVKKVNDNELCERCQAIING